MHSAELAWPTFGTLRRVATDLHLRSPIGLVRIDYVFVRPGLVPLTSKEDCSLGGDHCRLFATIGIQSRSTIERLDPFQGPHAPEVKGDC